jgi:hypothetical protein
MSCLGDNISVRVNGVQVVSVQDSKYAQGRLLLSVGSFVGQKMISEARFNDLLIRER